MTEEHNKKVQKILVIVAIATIAIDQLTKWWALTALDVGDKAIKILGDLLGLRLVFNPGAALSLGASSTWLITLISIAAVIFILRLLTKVGSKSWAVSLGLILGGAVGNLIDRLLRSPGPGRGHVVDFIDYNVFVGNVADIALVVGAALVILLNLRGIGFGRDTSSTNNANEPSHTSSTAE